MPDAVRHFAPHSSVDCKFESSATNTNEDAIMPLVRIDISKTASRERVRDVGNAVYNAMTAVANVPKYDGARGKRDKSAALVVFSALVGAFALARAISDRTLSDDLLKAVQDFVLAEFSPARHKPA
jgi:hypothetical protein